MSNVPSITLTSHEEEIIAILSAAAQSTAAVPAANVGAEKPSQVIVRIAGGWVRDKLLGFESDDIDIALENCSGIEFANRVNITLNRLGYEEHKIGVIQANPDQSKHLETANVRILGTFVDCVNLRSEVYAENSRIPDIKFGTAEEDAMRRDFTINSMFYNIHTGQIEDYSGRGVIDLNRGVIQTPLPALITFKDDPLRVLRAIRFASRYNYSLEEDLIVAASSPMISRALREKISRERILVELDGMLAGSRCRPPAALWSIFALDLFDSVFNPVHSDNVAIDPHWMMHSSFVIIVVNALTRMVFFDDKSISNKEYMTFQSCRSPYSQATLSCMTAAEVIFAVDTNDETVFQKGSKPCTAVEIPDSILYSHLFSLVKPGVSYQKEPLDASYEDLVMNHRLLYLAASVSGLDGLKCRDENARDQQNKTTEGNESMNRKKRTSAQNIIKETKTISMFVHTLRQLKLDSKSTKAVETILKGANLIKDFVRRNGNELIFCNFDLERCVDIKDTEDRTDKFHDSKMREELGMYVREMKQLWQSAVIYACAIDVVESFDKNLFGFYACQSLEPPKVKLFPPNLTNGTCCNVNRIESSERLEVTIPMDVVVKYVMVSRLVHLYQLEEAWTMRPLFDSKSIGSELGIRQGPQIGIIIEQAIRWQLRNPRGNGEELMAFLKEESDSNDESC